MSAAPRNPPPVPDRPRLLPPGPPLASQVVLKPAILIPVGEGAILSALEPSVHVAEGASAQVRVGLAGRNVGSWPTNDRPTTPVGHLGRDTPLVPTTIPTAAMSSVPAHWHHLVVIVLMHHHATTTRRTRLDAHHRPGDGTWLRIARNRSVLRSRSVLPLAPAVDLTGPRVTVDLVPTTADRNVVRCLERELDDAADCGTCHRALGRPDVLAENRAASCPGSSAHRPRAEDPLQRRVTIEDITEATRLDSGRAHHG